MGYLTPKEKSILFSALTKEEKLCKENGLEDLVPVVKSLERKFYYDRFEKDIRNEVIDEFAEQIKKMCKGITIAEKAIDEIANQMKKE